MAHIRVALLTGAIFTLCWAQDSFDTILSDFGPCEESCAKSYSPHTNPSGEENLACSRGCRLYTICELVAQTDSVDHNNAIHNTPAKPVKEVCYNACIEAYNETSRNTIACKSGCEMQDTNTKTLEAGGKKEKEEGDDGPSIHLLSPLMQVRSVYSSFVGAMHVVRSSLVTYFMSDDNSIVAVESEPKIIMEIIADDDEVESSPLEAQSRRLPTRVSEEPSVVSCVSQRLGVPPYLVVASVLVLVLFTIYVIFAVCTTASPPKAKGFKDGLSVQSDPLPLPVKLVRPEDLTRLSLMEEEDLQAPPLPMKVKLPDTVI